jgi:hypothetical protein
MKLEFDPENLEGVNGDDGSGNSDGERTGDGSGSGDLIGEGDRTFGSGDGAAFGASDGDGSESGNGSSGSGSGDLDGIGDGAEQLPFERGTSGAVRDVSGKFVSGRANDVRSGTGSGRKRGRPRRGNSATGNRSRAADRSSDAAQDLGLPDLKSEGKPRQVSDKVFNISDYTKLDKNEIVEVFAATGKGIFYLIGNFLGQEHQHWLLDEKEAREFGIASWNLLKSFPEKKNKRLERFLKENAPWIKFAMVVGTISFVRVSLSVEISNLRKENAQLRTNNSATGAAATGNGSGDILDAGLIQ